MSSIAGTNHFHRCVTVHVLLRLSRAFTICRAAFSTETTQKNLEVSANSGVSTKPGRMFVTVISVPAIALCCKASR